MIDHTHDDAPTAEQIRQMEIRELRWRILRILYMARDMGTNEHVIHTALDGMKLGVLLVTVRRELEYLAGLKLIQLAQTRLWHAEITPQGIDVVEYTIAAPPGIARPAQW